MGQASLSSSSSSKFEGVERLLHNSACACLQGQKLCNGANSVPANAFAPGCLAQTRKSTAAEKFHTTCLKQHAVQRTASAFAWTSISNVPVLPEYRPHQKLQGL